MISLEKANNMEIRKIFIYKYKVSINFKEKNIKIKKNKFKKIINLKKIIKFK